MLSQLEPPDMSYSALAEECACWVEKDTPIKEDEQGVQQEVEAQAVIFRADFSMQGDASSFVKGEKNVEDPITENLFGMKVEEENETDSQNTNTLKFSLALCKAEVPEQLHCEPDLSPGLGKEDPEPTPMKEEHEELQISQEKEQLQGLFETKDSIFTHHCVESKQEEPLKKAILSEYPTLSRLKISKQQSFHGILNDHLTVSAAREIFETVEETVAKYKEENSRLRTLLRISPEITPSQLDALWFSLASSEKAGSSEQSCCKQERSTHLGNKNPEIKEEQEEKQHQGILDTKESIFPCPRVKSEWHQEDPLQGDVLAKYPTLSRLKISKLQWLHVISNETLPASAALEVFGALEKMLMEYQEENNQLRRLLPITPEIRLCRTSSLRLSLAVPAEEQRQYKKDCRSSRRKPDSKPPQIKQELQISKKEGRLHWFYKKSGPIECLYCRKRYTSKTKLKDHIRISHHGKPCPCKYCGKPFKLKGDLSKHLRSHTGDKPYSCGDCGKSFSVTKNLTRHKLIHTGEKPFSCSDCGMNFSLKRNLNRHYLIHTGEKPFKCGDCGKSFRVKETLTDHMRTHTGEKPLSCRDCGKKFNYRQTLRSHILTHTVEKRYICSECGKGYKNKATLTKHVSIHTVAKPFSSGESRKHLIRRPAYTRLVKCHTGEN